MEDLRKTSIIHEEKTRENLYHNCHKIRWTFAFNFFKNYSCFDHEKLHQTLDIAFLSLDIQALPSSLKKNSAAPRLMFDILFANDIEFNTTHLSIFPDSPMFMLFALKRCMSYLSIFLRQFVFFFALITYFTWTYVFYNLTMKKVTIWGLRGLTHFIQKMKRGLIN